MKEEGATYPSPYPTKSCELSKSQEKIQVWKWGPIGTNYVAFGSTKRTIAPLPPQPELCPGRTEKTVHPVPPPLAGFEGSLRGETNDRIFTAAWYGLLT